MRDWQKDLAMCAKATSGVWESSQAGNWYGAEVNYWQVSSDYATVADLINNKYDAEFIAEARQALPYWLGRVQELEAQLAAMREVIESARDDLLVVPGSSDPETWVDDAREKLESVLSSEAREEMLGRVKRLETVVEEVRKLIIREKCEAIPCPNTIKAYRKVLKILESSNPPTYKEPLERVQKLEAVAEAAKQVNDVMNTWPNISKYHSAACVLNKALAALDGDNA